MNPADIAIYRERYRARLAEHGATPQALGWADGRQELRFAALTELLPLDRLGSVLDVGCGFGDLAGYLRQRGFAGRYTGIDFVPELVVVGRRLHPDEELRVCDIAELAAGEQFDLVVASGIFNATLEHEDNWSHITTTLRQMLALSNVAVVADFLTSPTDFTTPGVHYTSPERLLEFARTLTRRVLLRHDYLPFEFAVYLFKDDQIVQRNRFAPHR